MDTKRRSVLRGAGAAGAIVAAAAAGLVKPVTSFAAPLNKAAADAKNTADAMKALGVSGAAESKDIVIKAPDIAENGAVVPIEIESKIPNTESIA
nr:thiosulfate oxidation carrier protein SoxY [Burkholderiales bacterium]